MKARRNSKSTSPLLNRLLAMVLGLLFCVCALGLGVVWMRHQISNSANNIRVLDRKVVQEERKLAKLGAELAREMSTPRLIGKNDALLLGMLVPGDSQIVRVSEDVDARLFEKSTSGPLTASIETGF